MKYGAELFLLIAVSAVAIIFWVPRFRLKRAVNAPFRDDYIEILKRNLPVYNKIPDRLRRQLQRHINQFLYQKNFYGCGGLEVDDEIKVTIAAQACLLLLNRKSPVYPEVKSVLVYPSAFVAPRTDVKQAGVVSHHNQELLGESWGNGRVILSWDHVQHGARDFSDGQNLVLHEFAHQLDDESGSTNGAPLLAASSSYKSWAAVLSREFEKLQKDAGSNHASLLDHYGATNPAEFFAVATETFFERPSQMASEHPELFAELKGYYRVDPREWL